MKEICLSGYNMAETISQGRKGDALCKSRMTVIILRKFAGYELVTDESDFIEGSILALAMLDA